MHKLFHASLLIISLAMILSACGPASVVGPPTQVIPVDALQEKPVPEAVTLSTKTLMVEASRPTKTLAQQLADGTKVFLPVTMTPPNPVPSVTGISPSSIAVGGGNFTLTVNGTNFVTTSVVKWNGANRATTYVSPSRLTAVILAADIAVEGTYRVTVYNPPTGGGTSSAVNFAVYDPNAVGYIADHRAVAEFASIPSTAVTAAKAKRVLFYHQSTGGYIFDSGLQCLAGMRGGWEDYPAECSTYAQNPGYYGLSNWNWPFWPEPMADAPAKMDQFLSLVPSRQSNYDIIGMKFCYVDGWNQDFDQYRTKMESLERQYPNKIFIWTTSALWADPGTACQNNGFNSCENMADFNNQLRAYALANNKPLYDIAAIESDGGRCQVAGYEGMCAEYYHSGGGHPTIAGSIRLAKGFWWLIAKISGWK